MTRLLLSGLLVFAVGCAGSGGALRADGPPVRMNQDTDEPLLLTHGDITGPNSSLRVTEDGMNGRFRAEPVSLRWTYQELRGAVGPRQAELELAEGDDTRVWGRFGGAPVDLILDTRGLHGYVGGCAYAMQPTAEGFLGQRDCGFVEEDATVSFPTHLQQRPLGEKAALLTLTLANDSAAHASAASLATFVSTRQPHRPHREGKPFMH